LTRERTPPAEAGTPYENYQTNPSKDSSDESRKPKSAGNASAFDPYEIYTKRSHALGAPVQGSEFKVQSREKLRNEAN
jgi:hypothetical protein